MRAKTRSRWILVVAAVLGGSTGCAAQTKYRPTEQVAGQVDGMPAARYAIPPEAPRGDVNVTSFGVVAVQSRETGERTPMIQLKMVVSNDNDTGPWTLDVRAQRLSLRGLAELTPALAVANPSGQPVVTVEPGQRRTVDLYFRPPSEVAGDRIPRFDLLWRVHTPLRAVAERTPFEEDDTPGRGSYVGTSIGLGLGPFYWYDPFYYPYFPGPPPVVYYVPGRRWHPLPSHPPPRYGDDGGRWRAPPAWSTPRSSAAAPMMPSEPHLSAPAPAAPTPAPAAPSPAPAAPSPAPAAPSPAPAVPSQPNTSAPAPR